MGGLGVLGGVPPQVGNSPSAPERPRRAAFIPGKLGNAEKPALTLRSGRAARNQKKEKMLHHRNCPASVHDG